MRLNIFYLNFLIYKLNRLSQSYENCMARFFAHWWTFLFAILRSIRVCATYFRNCSRVFTTYFHLKTIRLRATTIWVVFTIQQTDFWIFFSRHWLLAHYWSNVHYFSENTFICSDWQLFWLRVNSMYLNLFCCSIFNFILQLTNITVLHVSFCFWLQ